jgi:hypothetical protein
MIRQIMEHLLAGLERMIECLDAKVDINLKEMPDGQEHLKEEIKVSQEALKVASLEKIQAMRLQANLEERVEVNKEETIGALDDQYWDRHPAIEHCRQQKKWTQGLILGSGEGIKQHCPTNSRVGGW